MSEANIALEVIETFYRKILELEALKPKLREMYNYIGGDPVDLDPPPPRKERT